MRDINNSELNISSFILSSAESSSNVRSSSSESSNILEVFHPNINNSVYQEGKDSPVSVGGGDTWVSSIAASVIGVMAVVGIVGVIASYGFASASNNDLTTDANLV